MESDEELREALLWWRDCTFQERKKIAFENAKMTSVKHFHSSPLLITRAYRKHLLKTKK